MITRSLKLNLKLVYQTDTDNNNLAVEMSPGEQSLGRNEPSHPAMIRHQSAVCTRAPRFTMAWSEGKIFLNARSPVAPKKTKASEWEVLMVLSYG